MENAEQYARRKFLENELERLKIKEEDSVETYLGKNIPYGHVLQNLKKIYDESFINRFFGIVMGLANLVFNTYPEKSHQKAFSVADRIYNYGFWDGYSYGKAEELSELILTEPYNRISKN